MSEPTSGRMVWVDLDGVNWRIEQRFTGRWQLERWEPATEQWRPIGSYPTRQLAIKAAYGIDDK